MLFQLLCCVNYWAKWVQIKSADNRILQEQLDQKVGFVVQYVYVSQLKELFLFSSCLPVLFLRRVQDMKLSAQSTVVCFLQGLIWVFLWQCAENRELQEKLIFLQQQLDSMKGEKLELPPEQILSEDLSRLKNKLQSQVVFVICSVRS